MAIKTDNSIEFTGGGQGNLNNLAIHGLLTFSLDAERGGRQTGEKNFVLWPSGVFVGVSFT